MRRVLATAVAVGLIVGSAPTLAVAAPTPSTLVAPETRATASDGHDVAAAATTVTTIGADLSKPANSTRTCWGGIAAASLETIAAMNGLTLEQFVWISEHYYGVNFDYTGCTWWNVGRLPAAGQPATNLGNSAVPVGGGILKRVRVKAGPVVGRMQVVVLRFIRDNNSSANPGGPFFVAASDIFTPQPNTTTEIPMNIPVKNALNPSSNAWDSDVIALSVLEPDVPMPFWYGGGDPAVNGGVLAKYPAWQPGVEQYQDVGSLDSAGAVLMQGDVETVTADRGGGGDQNLVPTVALTPNTRVGVNTRGKRAALPLDCVGNLACQGSVKLQSQAANAGAAHAAKSLTYGSRPFSLAAGSSDKVTLKLSKAAQKKLRKGKKLVAYANVVMGSTTQAGFKVVLRIPKH